MDQEKKNIRLIFLIGFYCQGKGVNIIRDFVIFEKVFSIYT